MNILSLVNLDERKIIFTSVLDCGKDWRDLTKYPNVGNIISPPPTVNAACITPKTIHMSFLTLIP